MTKTHFAPIVLSLLLVAFLASGCKKAEDRLSINGQVTDAVRKIPLAEADVFLYGKVIQGGIFNNTPTIIVQTVTNDAGEFTIDNPQIKASDLELVVWKMGYFEVREILADNQVASGKIYETSVALHPEAWINLQVQNTNPFNSSDLISYRIISSNPICSDCCISDHVQGNGTNYNVTSTCRTQSKTPVIILWNVHKGSSHKLDSVVLTTPISDTLFYHLKY